MTEYVKLFGAFLWGLMCALLGIGCEYAGQVALKAGHGLISAADWLADYAFRIGVWD
jgi:hypothetical protein